MGQLYKNPRLNDPDDVATMPLLSLLSLLYRELPHCEHVSIRVWREHRNAAYAGFNQADGDE